MTTTTDRREARLRQVAAEHGWELAGVTTILWPTSQRQLDVLRKAWETVEREARAGTLDGSLSYCNYGAPWGSPDGSAAACWRPRAFWLWTRPDLRALADAPDAERIAGLRKAGELTEREIEALDGAVA